MYQNLSENDDLILPQTEEEFDLLTDEIMKRFPIQDRTHAAVVIAAQMQRLPPDSCYSTLKFLGGCILKSIAYSVALHKSRVLSQKAQIDHIAALLKTNPYDQQALDALETALKEGSDYAKEILSLYRPVDAGDNILKMSPLSAYETKGPEIQTS
jgi:hypothetical protein